LKNDPETSNWIVLHSLDITAHVRQISGEADFVVIIPTKGVLCVEVKACSSLHRKNGEWFYGLNTKPDARGPFRQASEAMHSIRKRIIGAKPDLSHIVFWSAVVFPFVEFSAVSDEWHQWQVVDTRAFRARPLGLLLLGILEKARNFLQERLDLKWFQSQSVGPTEEQCRIMTNMLRPNFEFFESPKQQVLKLSNELKYYTQEQFTALDAMEANARVAFSGPAGTGKTMLAIEAARRSALKGNRVLFICFNRHLGKWLEDQMESLKPRVITKTLHSQMLSTAGIVPNETEKYLETFWTEKLPVLATEKIMLEDIQNCFDEIIVDEAQDILRNEYLDFLDLSLEGGLASGQWRFFGDFEKQAIFGAANIPLNVFIKNRAGSAPTYALRMNCRNTPRIASLVHILGDLNPDYSKILRPDNGIEPELHYYDRSNDQTTLLIEALDSFYKKGLRGNNIVILSTRADTSCAARSVWGRPWVERIKPFELSGQGQIGYCSIHAFKGLEAPIIIVTDVDDVSGPINRALFYIAITRALQELIILAHDSVKNDILSILLEDKGARYG
jgi:hypothetical protein